MSDVKLWEFNLAIIASPTWLDRETPVTFRLRGTDAEAGAALEKIMADMEAGGLVCNGGRSEVTDNGTPTPDA